MAKITKKELANLVSEEVNDAIGGMNSSQISDDRSDALDRYLGEPYGNEIDGRSQIVTREVADIVEWLMPSLMKVFTSGDEVVSFEPQGPEDVEMARQATKYVNYVLMRDNDGFQVLYNWFKDALLLKNGVVKHYWDETKTITREEYQNLTDEEFNQLILDDELEVIEHTENEITESMPMLDELGMPAIDQETGEPLFEEVPVNILHDVAVKRTVTEGKVKIESIPPEEFLINKYATSVNDARFVAHRVKRTKSELIGQGYSKSKIKRIWSKSQEDGAEYQPERISRFTDEDTTTPRTDEGLWVIEAYYRIDWNNDGIDELRKITKVGGEILDNEEVDSVPFSSLTPVPVPHKFYGLSIYDLISDLQLIKTTLMRNLLDNMYLQNNGRYAVMEGQANIDDLLTSRPGGIVRVRNPQAVMPLATPQLDSVSFQMLDYLDGIKEERTGLNKNSVGLGEGALKSHQTATGVAQVMSAAGQRVEMIARVFAETGVKELMTNIYKLVQKYEDRERIVRLNNEWTPLYPSEWRQSMDCVAKVGLGYGNKDMNLLHLQQLSQTLQMIAQHPSAGVMIKPKNVYNLVGEMIKNMGMKNIHDFITDPGDQEQLQQPNPEAQAAQMEAQMKMAELQQKQQEAEMDAQIDAAELEIKKQEAEIDLAIKQQELEIKRAELALKQQELQLEAVQGRPVAIGPT